MLDIGNMGMNETWSLPSKGLQFMEGNHLKRFLPLDILCVMIQECQEAEQLGTKQAGKER